MLEHPKPEPGPIRKLWRRLKRPVLWAVSGVTLLVVAYLVAALVLGLLPVNADYRPPERGVEIFIRSNGVHTDFILPVRTPAKSWPSFAPLVDDPAMSASAQFVGFGWGDRELFLNTPSWADLTFETAFHAVFLPSATAMHVSYWQFAPDESETSKRLLLTRAQHDALVEYITSSFVVDERGKPKHIAGSGYGDKDTFYEANGSYHLFFTCNEWTNQGLKRIGVRAARWSPFDTAIFYQLHKIQ